MRVTIETQNVERLSTEGENIFLSPEAESEILKLLAMKDLIEKVEADLKERLLAKAKELNPNFKKLVSDNLRIYARSYGAKYYVDESQIEMIPEDLYKTEVEVVADNKTPVSDLIEKVKSLGWEVKATKTKGEERLKINRTVDSKAVEKWEKEHKGMPAGIVLIPDDKRPFSISISQKGGDQDEK